MAIRSITVSLGISLLFLGLSAVSACSDWKTALNLHNSFRLKYSSTPTLKWNTTLQAEAKAWAKAQVNATGCFLKPSRGSSASAAYGENLYGAYGTTTASCAAATKTFYSAASKYIYSKKPWTDNKAQFNVIGQFTQVVWKATAQLGCGSYVGPNCYVIVCRYSPPGNVVTDAQFLANVRPLKGPPSPPKPPSPPPSPSPPPQPPAPKASACVDKSQFCGWAVQNNYCEYYWTTGGLVKDSCPVSCKACPPTTGRRLSMVVDGAVTHNTVAAGELAGDDCQEMMVVAPGVRAVAVGEPAAGEA